MNLRKEDWPKIEGFRLEQNLGMGGYSVVFKAIQNAFDRIVKIKLFWPSPHVVHKEKALQRFDQEAKIISRLDHQSIERYYDLKRTSDGKNLIITGFFEGESIKSILLREGHMNFEKAVEITIKICDCIRYCHDNKVIHRDIKPTHVIVNNKGNIKVIDFGIAYDFEEKIRSYSTSTAIGTVGYMSPEQRDDPQHRDERNDIYSIGVTMYEILTGCMPNIGKAFVPVAECIAGVDARIDNIITMCILPEEKRYQSINQLLNALQSLEFIKQQEKREVQELKRKSSDWARMVAEKKKYLKIKMETVRKEMEKQRSRDEQIWITALRKHIADLEQLVMDLNSTGEFKIVCKWEELTGRPAVRKGTKGPTVGTLQLTEKETMRVALGFLDPGRNFLSDFVQPCIIWETTHSARSPKTIQEMFYLINKDGHIKVYNDLRRRGKGRLDSIQEVYREYFEKKLLYDRDVDRETIDNILSALSSNHYHYRRDQGYDIIEKMVRDQIPLSDKIANRLFSILGDSSIPEMERALCTSLLRKSDYVAHAESIMDLWNSCYTQMSNELNEEIVAYFTTSIKSLHVVLERLEYSEPIETEFLLLLFRAVQGYVTKEHELRKEIKCRIKEIVDRFANSDGMYGILNDIHKRTTGKPLRAGREINDLEI